MTEERMASLLAYCKLTELANDPEVQALIPVLYESAVGYLANAGISPPEEGAPRTAQYDLVVNYMVADGWDHREVAAIGTAVSDNPIFRRHINQLKQTEGLAARP